MAVVENGKVVTVNFELHDAQGEMIQPLGGDPIVYLQGGESEVFEKIQTALSGKAVGDEVFVQLEPNEAFGDFDPEMIRMEPVSAFPESLEIGAQIMEMPTADPDTPDEAANDDNTGFDHVWTVVEIVDDQVLLDGNHPLAGVALRYRLVVTDIRDATAEEKANGAAAQSLFTVH